MSNALGRRRVLMLAAGLLASPTTLRAEPEEVLEVDLSGIAPGTTKRVQWNGKPVLVRHRTSEEISRARDVTEEALPDPETDAARVQHPQWLVVVGLCTHAGCIPNGPLGRYGGWYCLCHGSEFDTAGRVRQGPARTNMAVPPYRFISEQRIRIGETGA